MKSITQWLRWEWVGDQPMAVPVSHDDASVLEIIGSDLTLLDPFKLNQGSCVTIEYPDDCDDEWMEVAERFHS